MKNITQYIGIAVLALNFAACSDFLDEKGYKTNYTYYDTEEGIEALVVSVYQNGRAMFSTSLTPAAVSFNEMGADLYTIGGDGDTKFSQYTSLMNSIDLDYGMWNDCFNGIARANLGLQQLALNETLNGDTKKVREGELKFLRAYYYSMLVVHYGDVPLQTEPVDEPKFDFVRAPQKEIWAQIIADATDAYNLLPWADANGNVTGDYGRASKGAACHLLAKAHMFRYVAYKYASQQSDVNMVENRGGSDADLDMVIKYANEVCNFGTGAGSGSLHKLEPNFANLWRFSAKTGGPSPDDYAGLEALFTIQFSTEMFWNNMSATETNSGANWLHMMFTAQMEGMPLNTANGKGTETVSFGTSMGVGRDMITGRGWRRTSPTPYLYADDGLYGPQYYESGKSGKLIDSRLYKSHVWEVFCNQEPNFPWAKFTNAAGSFDPASIGAKEGDQRYFSGDTAIVFSTEDLSKRFPNGSIGEKKALARSMEPYWYIPMGTLSQELPTLSTRQGKDAITQTYPSLIKYLDSRRPSVNDQAGFRDYFCYRLASTFIMLSEAYAMKGDFQNAADALNVVRERAAWKEDETKNMQTWKYDGGSYEDRNKSTINDMKVSATFLQSMSDDDRMIFYLDESGRETEGELHRFEDLVRNGADFFVKMIKARNYIAAPNVKPFHRFRPIPQTHIDRLIPADPNGQNYGY
jgi:hypothetical protein